MIDLNSSLGTQLMDFWISFRLYTWPLIAIIWLHFFSDFILQTNMMATKKSSSNFWLSYHILVYTIPFLIFGWKYALVNGVAHWITDFFSSRLNKKLWEAKKVHWFFVGVGADQAIHLTTLFLTYPLVDWSWL